jgi:hypothetical protein
VGLQLLTVTNKLVMKCHKGLGLGRILLINNLRTGIIRIIKSRKIKWAGNVARTGEKRNSYRILVGKPE